MKKSKYMATIYDGHTHIERRVYEDEKGTQFVKINGAFYKTTELKHFDIDVWYEG